MGGDHVQIVARAELSHRRNPPIFRLVSRTSLTRSPIPCGLFLVVMRVDAESEGLLPAGNEVSTQTPTTKEGSGVGRRRRARSESDSTRTRLSISTLRVSVPPVPHPNPLV